ncbi:hypothetical protein [Polaromonas sp. C04]|uniref:hypothetical protein n=1 Tax=Polaromonas sp. C04 TaxID=1945857 RepID=UPI001439A633|nr:hypothetical protein [Polaromonas sp. C04]
MVNDRAQLTKMAVQVSNAMGIKLRIGLCQHGFPIETACALNNANSGSGSKAGVPNALGPVAFVLCDARSIKALRTTRRSHATPNAH